MTVNVVCEDCLWHGCAGRITVNSVGDAIGGCGCKCHYDVVPATPKPTSTPHTPDICKGFMVEVRIYTDDGRQVLSDPEKMRYLVGTKFDAHGLSEEVDYTLEVRRIYEQ